MSRMTSAHARSGFVALVATVVGMALSLQACGPAEASHKIGQRFFGLHARALASALPKVPFGAVDLTTNKVDWPDLEPTPGSFRFTTLDRLVSQARSRGAKPLLVLGKTPVFHSTDPGAENVRATVPRMDAWKTYVRAVADRYGARLDYGVWPEPNISENWAGTPKQLADLVSAAAKIIHARARHAVVVSPAFVIRRTFEQKFMDNFFGSRTRGKPVGRFIDAVGLDLYPLATGTPEDSAALLHTARRILHRHKVKAPVWNVEINYGVVGAHAPITGAWSHRKQQSYLVRNYVLDAGAGVKRVYWLGWFPIHAVAIQLVKADGVTPTPAARSLAVVRTWLTGQRVSACSRAKKTHVWSCKMVEKRRASWVYWVTHGRAHVRAPQKTRHVTSMTGSSRRIHAGKRLKVTTAPIWVHR